MSKVPFPEGSTVADGDVFFHNNVVCYYHKADNTWECRTIGGLNLPDATTKRIMKRYGSPKGN